MPEISSNYQQQYQQAPYAKDAQMQQNRYGYHTMPERTINDEFVHQHKKNGLFERLYNGIKNLTGLGVGSKKAKIAVNKAENGEISEDEARATIQKYRNSQANSAQVLGDAASIAASGATFFGLRKWLKTEATATLLNEKYYNKYNKEAGQLSKWTNRLINLAKSKTKMTLVLAGAAGIAGSVAKVWTGRINRIGSKEFTADKKDFNNLQTPQDKAAYKARKKELKRAKRKQNWMNRFSGAINGLMMPITVLGGAIAGVPLYLAGNTLNRYFVGNTNEHDKSFNGYVNNLKQDGVLHGLLAAGLAVPLFMKGKFASVFDKNLQKSFEKLKDAKLKPTEFQGESTYQKLESILMGESKINSIIYNSEKQMDDVINELTNENIFAVKFKQIRNDGSALAQALKEDCPPTRCFRNTDGSWDYSKIQAYVNENLGSGYTIEKSLGAGTIAETYLAKTSDGKEVCLKVLKDGITAEKIEADRQKFIEIIKNRTDINNEEKEHLIRNINDLGDSIAQEVNFTNEMTKANELAKYVKTAKVVKPLEVKNGIYVMERAEGISLASLVELNTAKNYKDLILKKSVFENMVKPRPNSTLGKLLKGAKTDEEKIRILDKYIEKIESRTPQYGDISLSKEEFKFLMEEYQSVLTENFYKLDHNGKVLHGDIHPGNIFIDVKALKEACKKSRYNVIDKAGTYVGKRKSHSIFTLIDTGNTITLSPDQALRSMKLSAYIKNGNVTDITDYVLEGATLPNGMSKEQASELISKELKTIFFDNQTHLDPLTNNGLLEITSSVMRKNGIIPADTQLNFNKAIASSEESLGELAKQWVLMSIGGIDINNPLKAGRTVTNLLKDAYMFEQSQKKMISNQERLNLAFMTPSQRAKQKHNPNMLKTNSEDHLTFVLKQKMKYNYEIPAEMPLE